MELTLLKSKLHRAVVTEAQLHYVGSITIDSALMKAANILEYEKVLVVDIDNGNRFETYAIAGEENSGMICLNGAAARCVQVGDRIIIMTFAQMPPDQAMKFKPAIVILDECNKIVKIHAHETHGELPEC